MPEQWVERLVTWFAAHQRVMPWRSDPLPYRVWVSEMMLQQTQVDTVIDYFNRFLEKFPTVQDLASADLQEVLKLWEGLGYYSRARNLHKAAKQVVAEFSGELPSDYFALQKLPGLGPYCAAAITSIAFGNPVPVVDGNVLRVFARFWGIEDDILLPKVRKQLFDQLTPYIQTTDPSAFNQAMMELGALLCKPTSPQCDRCPLSPECFARRENKTQVLPVKAKKAPVPHYDIAVGIIWKNGQILVAKRKVTDMLGGLWEFPGGKQKSGETLKETVLREVLEETSLTVKVNALCCKVNHAYTHFKITLHAFHCDYVEGVPQPNTSDEIKWVPVDELRKLPFPTANIKVIESILQMQTLPLFYL